MIRRNETNTEFLKFRDVQIETENEKLNSHIATQKSFNSVFSSAIVVPNKKFFNKNELQNNYFKPMTEKDFKIITSLKSGNISNIENYWLESEESDNIIESEEIREDKESSINIDLVATDEVLEKEAEDIVDDKIEISQPSNEAISESTETKEQTSPKTETLSSAVENAGIDKSQTKITVLACSIASNKLDVNKIELRPVGNLSKKEFKDLMIKYLKGDLDDRSRDRVMRAGKLAKLG